MSKYIMPAALIVVAGIGAWGWLRPMALHPSSSPMAAAVIAPSPSTQTPNTAYVASAKGKIFHLPACKWAEKIKADGERTFTSRADAIAAGLRPCMVCKP